MQITFVPEGNASTPFNQDDRNLEAASNWNGIQQENARMWQIIALASLSSFFIALGLIAYAIRLPDTKLIVVAVTPDGQATYFGKVDKTYTAAIPEISKEYQIKQFISLTHIWVIDADAQRKYIADTERMVQGAAIGALRSFYTANNPFNNIGILTQSVKLEPVLRQTDKTYVVYFTVTQKNSSGYDSGTKRYSALVNIEYFDSTFDNPLGLYITNFDIKQTEDK
jgi:type IV secretory pathway TrbF-like protein